MNIDLAAMEERIARRVAALLEQSIGDDVLTTEQAAELLKLHPVTVSKLAQRGELPAQKIGSIWRFRRSALLAHVTPSTPTTLPQADQGREATDKTVGKYRTELEASSQIAKIETRTVTRDGTTYTQNTLGINVNRPTAQELLKNAHHSTPPTPEQLVRRARVRAWVERNWHLLGKPWPGTETTPETPTPAK